MSATILLVEDNPSIMDINSRTLKMKGYRVLEAESINQARALYSAESPDLIILDILLPDGNGIKFCEELRQNSEIPILFLTALDKKDERIEGFRAGGDDYLPKPYDIIELGARVAAILKRSAKVPDYITKGNLTIKIPSNEIVLDGETLRISQNEFLLLLIFMQNEDRFFDEESLYKKVWGQPLLDDNQAVRSAVSRLRKKIHTAEYDIIYVRGQGYVFEKN